MKRISIIGLGKIGQGIAANILMHGLPVNAVDIDTRLCESFENGTYDTNEPGVKECLVDSYKSGQLKLSNQFSLIKGSDAIIITIPLLVDKQKKILDEPFIDCVRQIAPYCEKEMVIVIETSMPVGFGRGSVVPALEALGKKHGTDFLLAHSPERIKSGTMLEQLPRIPKVIGGVSQQAAQKAYEVYRGFFEAELLFQVESIEAAEMLKLAGMIYRDINIALSNQLAQFAHQQGINFTDLIPLINADKEANLLQPGIGVGGHCTPVYPYFMIDNFTRAGLDFSIAQEGRKINDGMAAYAVSLVRDKVKNKTALLLGLGFRPNVKEDSLSTTYILNDVLKEAGFDTCVHDVEYGESEITSKGLKAAKEIYGNRSEVIFLVTMHKEYYGLDLPRLAKDGVRYLVDGRNAMDKEKVEAAGIVYIGIGR
ncbi:MAG TPA: nucleotide sugar dehydrogenase [Chitinophagaceae bacterium]|nr:nucleotide sugar dehydrogenase [Chitinophagaceae bacterium]